MKKLRVHFVAVSAALSVSGAGAATYMLLADENGALQFAGWMMATLAVSYPLILVAMRSSHDRCSEWLRHLAAAGR